VLPWAVTAQSLLPVLVHSSMSSGSNSGLLRSSWIIIRQELGLHISIDRVAMGLGAIVASSIGGVYVIIHHRGGHILLYPRVRAMARPPAICRETLGENPRVTVYLLGTRTFWSKRTTPRS